MVTCFFANEVDKLPVNFWSQCTILDKCIESHAFSVSVRVSVACLTVQIENLLSQTKRKYDESHAAFIKRMINVHTIDHGLIKQFSDRLMAVKTEALLLYWRTMYWSEASNQKHYRPSRLGEGIKVRVENCSIIACWPQHSWTLYSKGWLENLWSVSIFFENFFSFVLG